MRTFLSSETLLGNFFTSSTQSVLVCRQNSARVLWQHEVFQTATPNDLLMLDVTLTDVGIMFLQ